MDGFNEKALLFQKKREKKRRKRKELEGKTRKCLEQDNRWNESLSVQEEE